MPGLYFQVTCRVVLKWVMRTRGSNPTKAIGLGCFAGNDGHETFIFQKRLSERFDSDESERNQSNPSIHGAGVEFLS